MTQRFTFLILIGLASILSCVDASPVIAQQYELDKKIGNLFFEQEKKCRALVRDQKWKEGEEACIKAVELAKQFPADRELEKSGAYEWLGLALLGQKRAEEALLNFKRAVDEVRSRLTESDVEMGELFGFIAMAHHQLKQFDKAFEFYLRAEKIYQTALSNYKADDPDEDMRASRSRYLRSLKRILEYHLLAAEEAKVPAEIEAARKLLSSLP